MKHTGEIGIIIKTKLSPVLLAFGAGYQIESERNEKTKIIGWSIKVEHTQYTLEKF